MSQKSYLENYKYLLDDDVIDLLDENYLKSLIAI